MIWDCSTIRITGYKKLEGIKNKALKLNLPIMNRKWDRIVDNRILKSDKYSIVEKLLKLNMSVDEIINETKFSNSLIYKVKKNMV